MVGPNTNALASLQQATSEAFPDDPLLRTYRPQYLKTWKPHLSAKDSIRICYSTWESVHPRTAAAFGHSPQAGFAQVKLFQKLLAFSKASSFFKSFASQDTHFYVVLRWHLPEEMADQLMQLARINPDGDSWEQLARRKEFELAIQISIAARENIIRRFLAECNLETKKSDGRFTHTTTDVLLPDVVATGVSNGVAFYSGCAATDREQGGVLSMTQNDPDQNYFWWHGPYTPDNPGGEPWDQDAALHGMPCTGIGLTWKKQVLEILAECGHRIEYGYAKLTPIAT